MPESPMLYSPATMRAEKRLVAGHSVLAAFAITGVEDCGRCHTGSLGILSEAAHSGLDLIAALITFLSVRVSDKPRMRPSIRARQGRELFRVHRNRAAVADLRVDHLRGDQTAVL